MRLYILLNAYDAAWRQTSVCSNLYDCYATSASYTALDQPSSITLGSGVQQSYTYQSPMARLGRLQVTSAGNSLFDRSYGYDNVGNVQTIVNNLNAEQQNYWYDPLDRLTNWDTSTSVHEQYVYDTIGNLTSKAGTAYIYGATNNGPHQAKTVGGQTYSYDNNGNLQSGGGRNYTWNAENQPSSISYNAGSSNDSYAYDADGERVSRSVGVGLAQTTTYYIGGLYEFDSAGNTRLLYQFGGQTAVQRSIKPSGSSKLYYLHGDHLGSVSLTTDASGNLVSSQEYKPWGEVRSGGVGETTLNYTGQRKDDTGLLYYHARYYDPVLARFVSADDAPIKAKNPQNLNRYSYVDNNPLIHNDPTGHDPAGPCDAGECYTDQISKNDIQNAWADLHWTVVYPDQGDEQGKHAIPVNPDGSYPNHFQKVDQEFRAMEDRWQQLRLELAKGGLSPEEIAAAKQEMANIQAELSKDLFFLQMGFYPPADINNKNSADYNAYHGQWEYNQKLVNDTLTKSIYGEGPTGGPTAHGGYLPTSRILAAARIFLPDGWNKEMADRARAQDGFPIITNPSNPGGCGVSGGPDCVGNPQ